MKYNPQKHHRRSIRLKGYDYSQAGAYFITICTKDRQCLFGDIINGEMILNEMGKIAYDEWLKTPELRPNVSLDVFAIMPNHMHGIIVINDDNTGRGELHSPNNDIINESDPPNIELNRPNHIVHDRQHRGEFDSPNDIIYGGEFDSPLPGAQSSTPFRSPSNNIGAIVRGYKSSVTKQINLLNYGGSVWQRNYHEHIIRNERSYQRIYDYIIDNPKNWIDDRFYIK